jgi:hypothetical protein
VLIPGTAQPPWTYQNWLRAQGITARDALGEMSEAEHAACEDYAARQRAARNTTRTAAA